MKIIISGAYAIGIHLAKLLSRNNEDITLIDEDGERLSQIGADFDLLTLEGNPGSINILTYIIHTFDLNVNFIPSDLHITSSLL
jgi:trk system potassium uptake protein TrkA